MLSWVFVFWGVFFAVLCVLSSVAIIALGKREMVALFLCDLNAMSLFLFFDSSPRCHGWSVVCDCGISWSCSRTTS